MATVIGKRFNKTNNTNVVSDSYDWLIATLSTLFTFTKTVDVDSDTTYADFSGGKKLYVTDHTYLYVFKRSSSSGATLCILAGNDTAGPSYTSVVSIFSLYSNSAAYVEIIKSAAGDILIKCQNQGSNVSTFSTRDITRWYGIAVVKCKDIISDADTYGIIIFRSDLLHYVALLVTDDTEGYDANIYDNYVSYCPNTRGTTSNRGPVVYGENTWAKITALAPICSVSSECVAVSSYFTLFTPEFLWGNAELDDEKYYFSDQFVMLDEAD